MKVLLSQIVRSSPHQVRIEDDKGRKELTELSQQISSDPVQCKKHELLQAPVIRPIGEGNYEIVAGHRRIAAVRLLGWNDVEVDVRKMTDAEAHKATVMENAHRVNLSPVETALAMNDIRKTMGFEEAARLFSVTKETVLSYLRILELPPELLSLIHDGTVAKSAVPALINYTRVAGEKAAIKKVQDLEEKHGDVGSHQLIESIKNAIAWDKNYASLEDWNAHKVDIPYDKEFDTKKTLIWKNTKIMEMAGITNADDYNALFRLVIGGVNVLAQPFLGEPLTQKQTEIATIAIKPPACNVCPLRMVVLGTDYCCMKSCLIRKRRSWSFLKFSEYLASSKLTKYSLTKDGLGISANYIYREKEGTPSKEHLKLVEMMNDPATTLRLIEHNCTDGVWAGTKHKYAQLIDVSKESAKRAAEEKAERNSKQSHDDYFSPENVAKRKNDERIKEARRNAYMAFIREKVIDLILPLIRISVPEMSIIFSGVDDKTVKENLGIKSRFNDNTRLEYYRRYFLLQRRWNYYDAEKEGVKEAVDKHIIPLLNALKIELPDGFNDILAEYVTQGDTISEEKIDDEEEEEEVEEEEGDYSDEDDEGEE
jgi:ParB/RepB/Spo0J family partition protein